MIFFSKNPSHFDKWQIFFFLVQKNVHLWFDWEIFLKKKNKFLNSTHTHCFNGIFFCSKKRGKRKRKISIAMYGWRKWWRFRNLLLLLLSIAIYRAKKTNNEWMKKNAEHFFIFLLHTSSLWNIFQTKQKKLFFHI